jgi:hypothetical protein
LFAGGALRRHLFTDGGKQLEIVGIVSDARYRQMAEPVRPTVFVPMSTMYLSGLHLVARTHGDADGMIPSITEVLLSIDSVRIDRETTLDLHLQTAVRRDRVASVFVTACALVILVFAISGPYLLTRHFVTSRHQELAVRLAIGARGRHIAWLVLFQAAKAVTTIKTRKAPCWFRLSKKLLATGSRLLRQSGMHILCRSMMVAALALMSPIVASAQTAKDPLISALEQRIAGREQEPAETVFANIRTLKGMPAIRVLRVMEQAFVSNLGVTCQHCHVDADWASDAKAAKNIARGMWALRAKTQDDVRAATGNATAVVTCYTCHKGQPKPAFAAGK